MKLLITYLFIFWGLYIPQHNIYISVVEINHTASTTSVSIKVFKDDLQAALQHSFPTQKQKFITKSMFCKKHDTSIATYFNQHFQLTINQKKYPLKFVKGRVVGDAYWLHFRVQSIPKWKTVHINAPFFMELFPNQSNILTFQYGKIKRFERLTVKKKTCILEF